MEVNIKDFEQLIESRGLTGPFTTELIGDYLRIYGYTGNIVYTVYHKNMAIHTTTLNALNEAWANLEKNKPYVVDCPSETTFELLQLVKQWQLSDMDRRYGYIRSVAKNVMFCSDEDAHNIAKAKKLVWKRAM